MDDASRRETDATTQDETTSETADRYGSTTGATANRHSAGPSGLGQSSGRGGDAVRDPERMSGASTWAVTPLGGDSSASSSASSRSSDARGVSNDDFGVRPGEPSGSDAARFATGDPGMADEPAEGGEAEVSE